MPIKKELTDKIMTKSLGMFLLGTGTSIVEPVLIARKHLRSTESSIRTCHTLNEMDYTAWECKCFPYLLGRSTGIAGYGLLIGYILSKI